MEVTFHSIRNNFLESKLYCYGIRLSVDILFKIPSIGKVIIAKSHCICLDRSIS